MEDLNFRKGDAKTEAFGSNRMLQPSPVEKIPDGPTTPEQYKERGITPFRTVMRTTYDIDQPGKGSADTDPLATQRN